MAPGARFILTDSTKRGITFNRGEGATFENLTLTYASLPSSRSFESTLIFMQTKDTTLRGAYVEGSNAIGIAFHTCTRPSVYNATVRNVMADGLHFANCQQAKVEGLLTENTGDDGLAIHNFVHDPDLRGAHARDITVRDSKSRGIAVEGQSEVVVEDFLVEGTAFSGICCAQEPSWHTRVPERVRFSRGEVRDAGKVMDPEGKSSVRYGILYERVRSVEFEDVKVYSAATRGVYGDARGFVWRAEGGIERHEGGGEVTLTNVQTYDASEEGFYLLGGFLTLDELTARDSGKESFRVAKTDSMRYGELTSINASRNDGLGLASSFEDNALVEGGRLDVVDDQSLPTGYKVTTGGSQSGRLGLISDNIANGDLVVENSSSLSLDSGPTQPPPA